MDFESESMSITPPSSPILGYSGPNPNKQKEKTRTSNTSNKEIDIEIKDNYSCFHCKGQLDNSPSFSFEFAPDGMLKEGQVPKALEILKELNKCQDFGQSQYPYDVGNGNGDNSIILKDNYNPCDQDQVIGGFFGGRNFEISYKDSRSTKNQIVTLLRMARKNVQSLEILCDTTIVHFSRQSSSSSLIGLGGGNGSGSGGDREHLFDEKWDPWTLRREVCQLSSFLVKNFVQLRRLFSVEEFQELLNGFRNFFGTVENWSDSSKFCSGFSAGNQSPAPGYHLFHLYLEIRWTYLILFELSPLIISWIFDDLVLLAFYQFESKQHGNLQDETPFNCYCVKELWIMIKLTLDSIKGKQIFWENVHSSLIRLEKAENFLFSIWLFANLASLSKVQEDGRIIANEELPKEDCGFYDLLHLHEILKTWLGQLGNEKRILEVTELSNRLVTFWGFDSKVLLSYWEFWFKNIDKNFHQVSSSSNIYSSSDKWLKIINTITSSDSQKIYNDPNLKSDPFIIFLRYLYNSLRRNCKKSLFAKLTSAINIKLTKDIVGSFQEVGITRISSLYFVLEHFEKNVSTRLNEILEFVNPDKVTTALRARSTMYLLLISRSIQNQNNLVDIPEYMEGVNKFINNSNSCRSSSSTNESKIIRETVCGICGIWSKSDFSQVYITQDIKCFAIQLLDSWICSPPWVNLSEAFIIALGMNLSKFFVKILNSSIWQTDLYLRKKLKEILTLATIRCKPSVIGKFEETHPGNDIMKSLSRLPSTDQQIILCDFSQHLRNQILKDQSHSHNFISFLYEFTFKSRDHMKIVPAFLSPVLFINITSNTNSKEKTVQLSFEIIFSCILFFQHEAQRNDCDLKDNILDSFSAEIEKQISFKSVRVFELLEKIISKEKMEALRFLNDQIVPIVEKEISNCEDKRGFGNNANLRRLNDNFKRSLTQKMEILKS